MSTCKNDRSLFLVGGGAGARVVTVPRGINPHPWLKELQRQSTQQKIAELREKFKGRKVRDQMNQRVFQR